MCLGHQRVLMEMYNEIYVFMSAKIASILQFMDQEVIFHFHVFLRNTFHKAVVAIDSNSSDGSE